MNLYDRTITEIESIGVIHSKIGASVCDATVSRERSVLKNIDTLIENDGITGLYPLKALLMASNNWHSFQIVREGLFQDLLLEGIDLGALAPDDDEGWQWMAFAAESNDPACFMTDMDRYFDMLMSATENGNQDARMVMDMIWEPENCQEED